MRSWFFFWKTCACYRTCVPRYIVHKAPLKGGKPFPPSSIQIVPRSISLAWAKKKKKGLFSVLWYNKTHSLPLFGKTEWEFEGIRGGGLFSKKEFFFFRDGRVFWVYPCEHASETCSKYVLCALILKSLPAGFPETCDRMATAPFQGCYKCQDNDNYEEYLKLMSKLRFTK